MALLYKGAYISGVSGDTKPTSNISTGTVFVETNTDKIYHYNGSAWDQIIPTSIPNASLSNSSVTIGDSSISLGGTDTTLTGLTDIDLTSGSKTIFDTVGSNTLTVGAGGTTVALAGNVTIGGTLTVNGTTTTNNSTIVTVDDPIFTLGGDTAPGSADTKDRGIEFRYFISGDQARVGWFGWDNSASAATIGMFTGFTGATNSSEVISGTRMSGHFNVLTVDNAITAGGIIKTDNTTEASNTTDGSLQTDGGLSVVKDVVVGDDIKLVSDNSHIAFGSNVDILLSHRESALSADAELGGVIVGTSDHPGVAASSLIISNATTDGDIMMIGSDGGNSVVYNLMDVSDNKHYLSGTLSVGGTNVGVGAGGINLQNNGGFGIVLQESSSRNNYFGVKVNAGTDETQIWSGSAASVTTPMVFYTSASGTEAERFRIDSTGIQVLGGGSGTSGVQNVAKFESNTSGTAAVGFGVGIQLEAENAQGAGELVGEIHAVYTDQTNTAEDSRLDLYTLVAGSSAVSLKITGGQVLFKDGSALLPSITNDGDETTGIYFPADEQVGVSIGGVDKLLLGASSGRTMQWSQHGNNSHYYDPGSGYTGFAITGLDDYKAGWFSKVGDGNASISQNYLRIGRVATSVTDEGLGGFYWQSADGYTGASITAGATAAWDASHRPTQLSITADKDSAGEKGKITLNASEVRIPDAGILLFEGKGPAIDHFGHGIAFIHEAGEAIAQFDLVYLEADANGRIAKADADAATTGPAIGISLDAISDGADGRILTQGFVRDDSWSWTAGDTLYLSTSGTLTATAPSGSGDQVQVMGVAWTADVAWIQPSLTVVEV